jgi:tryptophanyl-tRNA synthetase
VADLKQRYRAGRVGDVEVKKKLITALEAFLAPFRERRASIEARPDAVDDILATGNAVMRRVAADTHRASARRDGLHVHPLNRGAADL